MDSCLAGIRPEMDLHRMSATQSLGNQRNPLCGKKVADEDRIPFSNRRRL